MLCFVILKERQHRHLLEPNRSLLVIDFHLVSADQLAMLNRQS